MGLWEILASFYDFTGFHVALYKEEAVPLSSSVLMLSIVVTYLLSTFGLQKFMADRKGFSLSYPFVVHNTILSFTSFVLLLLMLENIIPKLLSNGLYWTCCDPAVIGDGKLAFFSYINYMLKYWELVDTFFLVFKKKDIQFLHIYHHALTLILCHVQLNGATSIQWVPITLNLIVHVLMYYYYAVTSLGINVWWKKYLTSLQISQFVIDIIFCWGAIVLRTDYDTLKIFGLPCQGEYFAAYFGSLLLSSYLLLFIDFFFKKYTPPATDAKHKTIKNE